MLKGKVLIRFRGENYSTIYEIGKIYDFEDARAKNLALRGLIEIVSEVVEKPLVNTENEQSKAAETQEHKDEKPDATEEAAETQEQETSDIFPAENERKARGRQRKTE